MHIFYTANIFWQQVKVKVVEKVLVVTGLEPGTVGLLDQCSTDWATRPTIMTKGIAKLGYTLFFSIVHKTVFAWPHLTDTLQQQSGQKCENIGKMGYLGAPECIMRLNDVIRASEVSWSSWRKWPSKLPIVLPFRNSKNSLKCENVGKMGYLGALESIMRSEPQIGAPEVPWSSWRKWPTKMTFVPPFHEWQNVQKCENIGKTGYSAAHEAIMRSESPIGASEVSW